MRKHAPKLVHERVVLHPRRRPRAERLSGALAVSGTSAWTPTRRRAGVGAPTRSDLFGRKKDHGPAEAALLARYGTERILNGGGGL